MIALFACLILGHQLALALKRRRVDPFDVKMLIDIVLLVMWVYAPLVNDFFRFTLENDLGFALTTFLGIVFLYVGLHMPTLIRKRRLILPWQSSASIRTRRWLWLALFLFIVATLSLTWQQIQYIGSTQAYFVEGRLSTYAYILNEANRGSIFDGIISLTRPILLLWLGILLEEKRWKEALILYLVLLVGIVMIAMTRLQVIITLLLPVFYLYYSRFRNRGSPFRVLVVLGLTVVSFMILFYLLYILNIWRTEGIKGLYGTNVTFWSVSHALAVNFNPIRGYYMLWENRDGLPHEYGLTYLYVLLTIVPRALWMDKPLVSHEARWTTYLFGQHFAISSDESWGVWTFTAWGEGLTQFGIVGVFLNLFLYGYIVSWMEKKFAKNRYFSLVWFYYSVIAAIYLRSSFSALAWTFLTLLPMFYVYSRSFVACKNGLMVKRPSG
jgi:oligosaccharide repeat unit polymerase